MTIAFRKNLFDEIDERKIHRGVVPRLGGISFLPAFIFSFCVLVGYDIRLSAPGIYDALGTAVVPVFFLLCALMLMYLVGIADDLIGVCYRAKFIFQIISGALIVMSGCWIMGLSGFMGIEKWPTILGWISTELLVIYVVNAINLIDGIDGLASGLSMIALGFYSYIFFQAELYIYGMLAAATIGTLVPFFYFNVFGSPERHTKIFMGDTGSLTIGTMLAFLSIQIFNIRPDMLPQNENAVVLAVAPIIVPCFDAARVFIHRIRRRHNPFLPDKCHIHHKLLALGCRQWHALILILAIDVAFILFNLSVAPYANPTWIIFGDFASWILLNMALTRMIRRKERLVGVKLYE